jgi:tetratricopeptide (TPR) repeat protein
METAEPNRRVVEIERMDDRLKHKIVAAKEHFDRREYDHAEPLLLQIVERNDRPRRRAQHAGEGPVTSAGDFEGAKEAFERAVEVNPTYTEAVLNLAVAYNDLGDYAAGREVFERLRASSTPSMTGGIEDSYALGKIANMHAATAQAYADIGYMDDAVRELQKATGLRPAFADLHARLGVLHRERGDLGEAQAAFEAACAANPNYVHARIQLGVTLFMLERKVEALEAFKRALDLEPSNKIAAMYVRLVEGRTG